MKALEEFIGSRVKLVFRDGSTVVAKRGKLTAAEGNFVRLVTEEIDLLVNTDDIVKIQRKNRGEPSELE